MPPQIVIISNLWVLGGPVRGPEWRPLQHERSIVRTGTAGLMSLRSLEEIGVHPTGGY